MYTIPGRMLIKNRFLKILTFNFLLSLLAISLLRLLLTSTIIALL